MKRYWMKTLIDMKSPEMKGNYVHVNEVQKIEIVLEINIDVSVCELDIYIQVIWGIGSSKSLHFKVNIIELK